MFVDVVSLKLCMFALNVLYSKMQSYIDDNFYYNTIVVKDVDA